LHDGRDLSQVLRLTGKPNHEAEFWWSKTKKRSRCCFATIWKAEGYDVETVARGDEAEIRLKENLPDLIVLDWMLPGLSGIELCRRLRARKETEADCRS
jgi:CheY-like chemotaxis protein